MRAETVINAFTAVGTVAVAVLAIWGDWLKAKLVPIKLRIEPHNTRGTLTIFNTLQPVIYYHLRVVNERPWMSARNCRVMLRALARRGPDLTFRPEPLPVPFQFRWAPFESTPAFVTIQKQQVLDFGFIIQPAQPGDVTQFIPALYSYPNDFRGFVGPGEAVRYSLEVEADDFSSPSYLVIEVAWDGRWTPDLDKMSQSLVVSEVAA
jgi:hypothetical protein